MASTADYLVLTSRRVLVGRQKNARHRRKLRGAAMSERSKRGTAKGVPQASAKIQKGKSDRKTGERTLPRTSRLLLQRSNGARRRSRRSRRRKLGSKKAKARRREMAGGRPSERPGSSANLADVQYASHASTSVLYNRYQCEASVAVSVAASSYILFEMLR